MGITHEVLYSVEVALFKGIFRYNYDVRGSEIPKRAIIASNHSSRLDAPALIAGLDKKIVFFDKSKPWSWPFLPPKIGKITLKDSSLTSLRNAFDHAKKRLEEGYYLGIFPEGGYNFNSEGGHCFGQIRKMNNGVFFFARALQLPVVPVSIYGFENIWPLDQKRPDLKGKIILNVGEPIRYEDYFSKEVFGERIRSELSTLLNESNK